jgi:hypothetical protein
MEEMVALIEIPEFVGLSTARVRCYFTSCGGILPSPFQPLLPPLGPEALLLPLGPEALLPPLGPEALL